MKIKRFDNLWLMGLILSASILGVIYILKILFPQFVIEVAQIDSITRIGHYIDTHKWAWYVATIIISYFTCFFYCGACCKRKNFNYYEHIVILVVTLFLLLIKELMPVYYTTINYTMLIVMPCIFKGNLKSTTLSFSFFNFLQIVTLEIRKIGTMIIDYNFATFTILTIDVYILLVLLYLFSNFKKEN